ncbi:hypothetical protein X965_17500 [Morganella sp. EGD-HP17]|nr:hypothetical protein X965_17500 [Morganella sp. EGD-HP17]
MQQEKNSAEYCKFTFIFRVVRKKIICQRKKCGVNKMKALKSTDTTAL